MVERQSVPKTESRWRDDDNGVQSQVYLPVKVLVRRPFMVCSCSLSRMHALRKTAHTSDSTVLALEDHLLHVSSLHSPVNPKSARSVLPLIVSSQHRHQISRLRSHTCPMGRSLQYFQQPE
jgi:hypothetical protein